MAVEEVGAKLVAYGEEEFIKAFKDCQNSIDHLETSLKDADKAAQKSGDEMTKASKKFTIFGQSLTDIKSGIEMAFGAFERGYQFAKVFIDSASDMNETVSKSKVVFGDMAGAVEDMGNRAAKSMGISKQEAIAAAATYGNLFVSMGMGSKVSAEMSMNLVQLASDFASFNNIPVADALEKIRAGLVGESEPLKSLGVNINEALLKQEALNLGLNVGTGVLDSAVKAQAAYSLMLKQSATAQGDFARTADGVANSQRILEAEVKNLQAGIGNKLLPIYRDLLKIGGNLIDVTDEYVFWLDREQEAILKNTKTYPEYIRQMQIAIQTRKQEDVVIRGIVGGLMPGLLALMDAETVKAAMLNEEQWKLETGYYKISEALDTYVGKTRGGKKDVDNLSASIQTQADIYDNARKLGEKFGWNLDDIAKREAGLKAATDNTKTSFDLVTASISAYNKQMAFKILADGLDEDAQIALSQAMGIFDPIAYTATKRLQELKDAKDKGLITTEQYIKAVRDLNSSIDSLHDKTVTITYNTKYTQEGYNYYKPPGEGGGAAEGGYIMGGRPIWVGERGPEIFVPNMGGTVIPNDMVGMITSSVRAVLPSLASIAAIGGNSYSTANNYNLNVMTSQSAQVVQRSFAMMQLLAG